MNEKEKNFWNLIQEEAQKLKGSFFMDSGEGHDINKDKYEGEDFSGWLIPNERTEEFEKDWTQGKENDDKWDSFYRFAEWKEVHGEIKIEFVKY